MLSVRLGARLATRSSLLVLGLAVLPAPAAPQAAGGTVTGLVVSATSGEPIAGCVIQVSGFELVTTTGQDGAFRLEGIPTGQQEITMHGEGFEPVTAKVGILFPGYVRDLGRLSLTAVALPEPEAEKTEERRRNDRNVITYEMIQESTGPTALDIVEQYRKNWLRRHTIVRQGQIVELRAYVHLDGARFGDVPETLAQFSRDLIKEIRFMSGIDSRVRFGPDYGGGMIEVITK